MVLRHFKSMMQEIAQQNPNGFTFNLVANSYPSKGYVVAYSETQDCVGSEGLAKVIEFCLSHIGCCVGGWRNEAGIMQYDASKVYYRIEDAVSAAIENRQRAFFNLNNGEVIMACDYHKYVGQMAA